MKFWTRLRQVGNVIVMVIAALALLANFLNAMSSEPNHHKPMPRAPQSSDSLRAPGGTTGL